MQHSQFRYFCGEAAYEMKMGLTSLVVPVVTIGLSVYMLVIFLNADYMRAMGGVDIQRNSAHLTYLMASGQSLWLFFGWAWLFAQTVVRDQQAQLQEVVLAAPVPLHLTLLARWSGALVIAVIMGSSVFLGFLSAPVLVWLGALPAEAVGPAPWAAFGWAITVFTIPNAMATGAVFMCAAIWTRSTAGPFAAAAGFALVWMIAMIVLRGGDVDVAAASVLDPSGYSEAERQSQLWTPIEKKTAILELTPLMVYNRALWLLLPLALMTFVLLRLRREQLAIAGKASVDNDETDARSRPPQPVQYTTMTSIASIASSTWISTMLSEAWWQFRLITGGFGVRLALLMLLLAGAVGAWVNFVGHVDGPLVPSPQGLLPYMAELFYLIIIFMVIGFIGALMRRDDRLGYDEWVDASLAPLWVRLLAKSLAALGLIGLLCLVPAISSLLVTGLGAPASLDVAFPFAFMFLTFFPALAEIGAVAILAHALFRHAGTAYVISILVAFIAIINHEVAAVEYPPAQIALPTHAHPSQLSGWGPWLPMVVTMAGLKMALFSLGIGFSWLLWRRGAALTLADRWRMAKSRLFGAAGAVTVTALISTAALASLLNTRLAIEGDFETQAASIAGDIAWEEKWWDQASAFTAAGGEVDVTLDPFTRSGSIRWRLDGLLAKRLQGTLPHGIELLQASVAGTPQNVVLDDDHFAIDLPACSEPCSLILELSVAAQGWPGEIAPWLHASGIWLRAENILPTLGHDPGRLVSSLGDRKKYAARLDLPPMPAAQTLIPITGVAPAGNWRWQISGPTGFTVNAAGSTNAMLDFAYVWLPQSPATTAVQDVRFVTSAARTAQIDPFANDLIKLRQCVSTELDKPTPKLSTVVQSPRDLGEIGLHVETLWAPEDRAWETTGEGLGGWQRQFNLARAMAQSAILDHHDLRAQHAAHWLLDGTAGWAALRCIEKHSGLVAAQALRKLKAEQLSEAFAETDEPITTTARTQTDWLVEYATLALENWAAQDPTRTPAKLAALLEQPATQDLVAAIETTFGRAAVTALLGPIKAADVAVINSDTGTRITATRWAWVAGGWQETAEPTQLLHRDVASGASDWVSVSEPKLPEAGLLIDASPRFERTPEDNTLGKGN